MPLRENNLIGAQHIRYGGYGGIAYHHIADSYIALFTSFIPCGVWEAVHILDGLMKNRSAIQPDTLHADTQGQSEPVFGLCRLLGIKLMPRMRNWDDVTSTVRKSIRYQHIDALFTEEIDWQLIATHWQDMMQVVLSIQAGLVLPSMLLRKLGTHNRKSLLCRAFRELGRVERTLFLLRYISTRRSAGHPRRTTKIESFNDFLDWITFGGPIIKSATRSSRRSSSNTPPDRQRDHAFQCRRSDRSSSMAADGLPVTAELAASLSPYSAKPPALRTIRTRHGRSARPAHPRTLPFKVPL